MAWQMIGENGTVRQVGGGMFRAAHTHLKPIEYVVGHYQTTMKAQLVAAQAANSRLFEIRNAGTNLLIPTRFTVTVTPAGPVAFPYLLELYAYKYTGFTAVDTTSVGTPFNGPARTGMAAYPGNAGIRILAGGGAAAGMTGGTVGTKSSNPFAGLLAWAASVSSTSQPVEKDLLSDLARHGAHPMMFAQDEGLVLENGVLGSATSNNVVLLIDFAWCEAQAY